MLISKKSPLTGVVNTREIAITEDELFRVEQRRKTGTLIQNIIPNVSKEDREFLITGYTPNDWLAIFGSDDI